MKFCQSFNKLRIYSFNPSFLTVSLRQFPSFPSVFWFLWDKGILWFTQSHRGSVLPSSTQSWRAPRNERLTVRVGTLGISRPLMDLEEMTMGSRGTVPSSLRFLRLFCFLGTKVQVLGNWKGY